MTVHLLLQITTMLYSAFILMITVVWAIVIPDDIFFEFLNKLGDNKILLHTFRIISLVALGSAIVLIAYSPMDHFSSDKFFAIYFLLCFAGNLLYLKMVNILLVYGEIIYDPSTGKWG